MHADGVVVDGDLRLAGATVTGAGEDGALRLLGARVGDEADFTGAVLTNNTGPAVEADRLRCGELRLTGVRATASSDGAAISVLGARVGGQVNLGGGVLTNNRGCALRADGIQVGAEFHADGVQATGAGEYGVLCLLSAHVGGHLYLEGAELTNQTGAALSGDRLRVDGVLGLGGATATGSGEQGTIRLLSARIDGHLELQETRIANDSGPALHADGLRVGRNLFFADAHASGAGEEGAIRLRGAEVVVPALGRRPGGAQRHGARGERRGPPGRHLPRLRRPDRRLLVRARRREPVRAPGSTASSRSTAPSSPTTAGPALIADRCEVRESSGTDRGARRPAPGTTAAVGLLGAQVGGQLSFTGAEIGHLDGGTLVSLEDAVVDGPVFLSRRLVGARRPGGPRRLPVRRRSPTSPGDEWLSLVRDRTADYRPGPYQRLAAVGAGRRARRQRAADAHRPAAGPPAARARSRSAGGRRGGSTGCGAPWPGTATAPGAPPPRCCSPWSPPAGSGSGPGTWATRSHRAAERVTDLTAKVGTPCTTVELIGVGLDRGLPLSPGVRGRCDLNTGTTSGQVFTVAIWAVQAAIWALATLALVGYTGLVRKPPSAGGCGPAGGR